MSDRALHVFDGATAVITGGASGIGRALGEELAKRGSKVVLADLQIELTEEVASQIRATGGRAEATKLDVIDFSAVETLLRETTERTGRLDYMFNNAGISIGGPVALHIIEDWNQTIDINLRGVVNGVQAAYQIMLNQGFGHIVNTAPLAGLVPGAGNPSYTTTKHAVVGLSKVLHAEAATEGIHVSVLCPGFVRTPILEGGGKYGKMLMELSPDQERDLGDLIEKFRPLSPGVFARKALDAIAKNKVIVVIPSWYKLFWWIDRLSPWLTLLQLRSSYQAMQRMTKG